jgi:hypothetical protein
MFLKKVHADDSCAFITLNKALLKLNVDFDPMVMEQIRETPA